MAPVDVSLCAQAYTSVPGTASGTVAEPTRAVTTLGSSRNGAAAAAAANFAENSPKLACALRRSISELDGDVPEGGGPAVAQRHLVAVGQREQLGQPGPGRRQRGS